jgi:hypothetical protein
MDIGFHKTYIEKKIIKLTEMEVKTIIINHLKSEGALQADSNPNIELLTEQGYSSGAIIIQETKDYLED